jgi:hypothetical protein
MSVRLIGARFGSEREEAGLMMILLHHHPQASRFHRGRIAESVDSMRSFTAISVGAGYDDDVFYCSFRL